MQNITEKNLVNYMDKLLFGLFCMINYVLVSELTMFCIIKFFDQNFTNNVFFVQDKWIPNFQYFFRHIILPTIINFPSFLITKKIYKKANVHKKKICLVFIFLLVSTSYSFLHWGFSYLSVIYLIPMICCCPLGKKSNIITFCLGMFLSLLYFLYQNYLVFSTYNFLIFTMNVALLVCAYFGSRQISKTFYNNNRDIENFYLLSENLRRQVNYDSLTGAFSKMALLDKYQSIGSYQSIGFIDMNNFKKINDTFGHEYGDLILKKTVRLFLDSRIEIYRYGGDEFVILYKGKKLHLQKICDELNRELENDIQENFSFGCCDINSDDTLESALKKSDSIMYKFKQEGKK